MYMEIKFVLESEQSWFSELRDLEEDGSLRPSLIKRPVTWVENVDWYQKLSSKLKQPSTVITAFPRGLPNRPPSST